MKKLIALISFLSTMLVLAASAHAMSTSRCGDVPLRAKYLSVDQIIQHGLYSRVLDSNSESICFNTGIADGGGVFEIDLEKTKLAMRVYLSMFDPTVKYGIKTVINGKLTLCKTDRLTMPSSHPLAFQLDPYVENPACGQAFEEINHDSERLKAIENVSKHLLELTDRVTRSAQHGNGPVFASEHYGAAGVTLKNLKSDLR